MYLLILTTLLAQTLGLAVPGVVSDINAANTVDADTLPFPSRQVFQFSQLGTWIENVAARSNGDLLFTLLQPAPQLYALTAVQSNAPQTTLLYEFPDMTGLLGITEIAPDVFVVAGGKFNGTANPIFGTFSLWQVSLAETHMPCNVNCNDGAPQPSFTKLLDLPYHVYPNGLTSVPGKPGVILIADSTGSLLRVDVNLNQIDTVAAVPEMLPVPGWPFLMGINGIKIYNGYVYWTNSFAATMYRMAIDEDGFPVVGTSYPACVTATAADADATPTFTPKVEKSIDSTNVTVETVVFMPITFMDDFAVADDGTLWITTNPNNTVVAYNQDTSKSVVVAGGQTQEIMAGANAAVFGRTDTDSHILYVVTAGGLNSPVNGTFVEPAKVMGIDTSNAKANGF
ncbi:quinoprotein amine dehydrogenase beta chain-like protein [Apiospora rasikravindrae]|uniref:Quinoprotein amine dehydrogenase beta chain-like protein n=1 Tax=Apiospora rasikravindrae TaxID=990691 RepID=A0ABR1SYT2_9PEZI